MQEAQGNPLLGSNETRAGGAVDEESSAETAEATVKIQAGFRGWVARKHVELVAKAGEQRKTLREFTNMEVLMLLQSIFVPLADILSDYAVVIDWATGDEQHLGWVRISLAVMFISGTITGLVFCHWNRDPESELTGRYLDNPICCCVLGWLGTVPMLQAYLALADATTESVDNITARRDLVHLKIIKALDLATESMPQLCLQLYVGVSFGKLDPENERFSWILSISVAMAMLRPGVTMYNLERLSRNGTRREVSCANQAGTAKLPGIFDFLPLDRFPMHDDVEHRVISQDFRKLSLIADPYGWATVLWRSSTVMAVTTWLALGTCAFQWVALMITPLLLAAFAVGGYEASFWRSDKDENGLNRYQADSRWRHSSGNLGLAACIGLVPPLCSAVLAWSFYHLEHWRNNYGDSDQHFDCTQRSLAVTVAWAASIACVPLMGLALLLEPQHGYPARTVAGCRGGGVLWSDESFLRAWLAVKPPVGHNGKL